MMKGTGLGLRWVDIRSRGRTGNAAWSRAQTNLQAPLQVPLMLHFSENLSTASRSLIAMHTLP